MSKKIYSVYSKAPEKPPKGLFGEEVEDKIVFREEQVKAINDARKHFEKKEDMQQFLWNAKMRFGKTLCALELARQMSESNKNNRRVKRVLIVTHRPVVNESWKEDFEKIFGKNSSRFKYGTKFENDSTGNFFDLERHANRADENGYVFFASMQYLRRSNLVNDNEHTEADPDNERLRNSILENDWDLVVIDEAHEGTRTSLGFRVIHVLKKEKTKLLHLSGTPFNLYEDFGDDEIYNWDYVMEQQAKVNWDAKHPGEYNPYAVLPHMNIFTYDLAKLVKGKDFSEDGSFKFKEFFRTWTGNPKSDGAEMPEGKKGRFVHEQEVNDFLDLMCKEDEESNYPFSTELYQDNFNHTLWIVPGVKEAKALAQLLKEHEIFSNFEIVNVAGNSDDDEAKDNALDKVHNAIGKRPAETATITISCGRLTTGVTVHPWTAVFYLKGSENTSAATYMQTIFRVQSTDTETYPGKMKAECYVFDFAPDRSLKMIAETAKFAHLTNKEKRAANTASEDDDIERMKEFMNFFAVVSLEGGKMNPYDAESLFRQLDNVYIDRVVRNGFNDNMIYDTRYLMSLDETQLNRLNELADIISQTTSMDKPKKADTKILITQTGVTGGKPKGESGTRSKLTPEEKKRREEERKERENRISILRGIALRIPLLIYGAKVDDEEIGITINNLTERIDDASWEEFMPRGITKEIFEEIKPCFNAKMFALAGKRYRQLAREADSMHTDERVKRIAEIFSYFHNPDKETVLTPWRVVNMHMSDTLGGYCFFNEKFDGPNQKVVDGTGDALFDFIDTTEPRFVDRGKVTADVFGSKSKILEINSKTGLYPLYVTYSIYRQRMKDFAKHDLIDDIENYSIEEEQVIWDDIVKNNIYVICNTPMAARITERTLLGFRPISKENIKEDKLIEQAVSDREELIKKLQTVGYWNGTTDKTKMKFDAVVGNPPYQLTGGSGGNNDAPIFQHFCLIADKLPHKFNSLIIPSRWFAAGRENLLGDFRKHMLTCGKILQLRTFPNSKEIFPNVEIKGGVCYYLEENDYKGKCEYFLHKGNNIQKTILALDSHDILIREPFLAELVNSVHYSIKQSGGDISKSVESIVSSDTPFGIPSNPKESPKNPYDVNESCNSEFNVQLYHIENGTRKIEFVRRKDINKNSTYIDYHKVFIPGAAGSGNDTKVLGMPEIATPNSVCSQSYLFVKFNSSEEANNFVKYYKTRFFRALVSAYKITQSAPNKVYKFVPIQDFTNNSDIDWTQSIEDIEKQLYKKYSIQNKQIEFVEKMITLLD